MLHAYMIALVAVSASGGGPGEQVNLTEALYNASYIASGERLCDRKLAARQRRRFDRRYGLRIGRLKDAYENWHGPDPDFIRTSSRVGLATRHRSGFLRRSLDEFEGKLCGLEAAYSRPPEVPTAP